MQNIPITNNGDEGWFSNAHGDSFKRVTDIILQHIFKALYLQAFGSGTISTVMTLILNKMFIDLLAEMLAYFGEDFYSCTLLSSALVKTQDSLTGAEQSKVALRLHLLTPSHFIQTVSI